MKNIISALAITLGLAISLVAGSSLTHAQGVTHDKYDHASACYGIELTLSQTKLFSKWKPWQRALFTTAVIGGGKEWYDARHPEHHTASWSDIAADAAGASAGEGMIWIIHKTF